MEHEEVLLKRRDEKEYINTYSFYEVNETLCDYDRLHLQQRIEDEQQCDLLIQDLREEVYQAFAEQIQDKDVLRKDYIRRVLHLRKVTMTLLWFNSVFLC